ncbi:MAG: hypothetical protein M1830_010490 [Pleopsidium flavum]|nr:MAG: hypothetical protein M1830_010490 [Pleopsidium flavum]
MVKFGFVHPQQPQLKGAGTGKLDAVGNYLTGEEADSVPIRSLERSGSVLCSMYELGILVTVEETMNMSVRSEAAADLAPVKEVHEAEQKTRFSEHLKEVPTGLIILKKQSAVRQFGLSPTELWDDV